MSRPFMGAPGNFTGLLDRKGNPVHIGDTLRFDPKEWGGELEYVLEFQAGELRTHGTLSDISEWCEVVRSWDKK